MKLIPKEVAIKEIMIDQYNPRFVNAKKVSQQELIEFMLESRSSKELLRSLQEDIKWVNRIVIQKIETHEKSDQINKKDDHQYVTIEGNTRLACLKSGKINDYLDETKIPILLAHKEDGESIESFNKQVRITQGIANVTVVKEWKPISKAKHLSILYEDIKGTKKPAELYKQISNELGIGVKEVRDSIIRYRIYCKISEISETIAEANWGYLEAFDKNILTRSSIGLASDTNEFLDIENTEENYSEILANIPDLINNAIRSGINTKLFRDIMHEIIKENDTSEKLNDIINDLLSDENDITLISKKKKTEVSDKDYWNKELDEILNKVSNFPNMAEWASELSGKLKSIKSKIKKHINVLES
ncbi:hypothetical protein [Dokdonia sp.]|uniref:hypothetical protein n=1 Tax=Dokdonia sp. TaxID=2024995 RepID=UPI0032668404